MTEKNVTVAMTEEEHELVRGILEERYRTFLREIARTDHHEFKMNLQRQAALLESVLSRMMVHA